MAVAGGGGAGLGLARLNDGGFGVLLVPWSEHHCQSEEEEEEEEGAGPCTELMAVRSRSPPHS